MRVNGAGNSNFGSNGPIVIGGGKGDDNINVTPNKMGGVDVTVTQQNGKTQTYNLTAEEADRLVLKGGKGDDNIHVDKGVKQNLTISGGRGSDNIKGGSGNDKIRGGRGDDFVHGGRGDDKVKGGRGDDSV